MRKTLSICAALSVAAITLNGCEDSDGSTETTSAASALSTGNGLKGEYYDNIDFTGPVVTRTDATVNFRWGAGAPATSMGGDSFSARWTGQVEALYSQTYTFFTTSDDGVRLWINGQQVINNWTNHPATENSGAIALTAGQRYDLKLEYYENAGDALVTLSWSSPSQAKQIIPQAQLYPPGSPSAAVCGTANETGTMTLSCPSGQTIASAAFSSYGTPNGSCGSFSKGTCDASTSMSVVTSACVGKNSCSVAASNSTFGDPCVGTGKRLYVQATCTSGTTTKAGNPYGSCSKGIPASGQSVDVSSPTTVVGSGSGCTFAALQAAVAKGGIITFNCGSAPVTIPVSATLKPPVDRNTVIDGGNKITLDGGRAVQIIRFDSPNFQANDKGLTLQHITLTNGKATPTQAIPVAPAPCSQGWNDGQGGAVYVRDGFLTVIDSIFVNNQAAPLGPDTGGGAIYALGSKAGVLIVGSTFTNNSASNAGAVGCLFAPLNVYDSLFSDNDAIGNGANYADQSKCSVINANQYEVGSGGNGGALYSDGNSVNVYLCGDAVLNNHAGQGAFGGGLFFTSNNMGGTLTIIDTTMTGNTGGWWTKVASGSVTNLGTAVGTNTKSITLEHSTLQGLN